MTGIGKTGRMWRKVTPEEVEQWRAIIAEEEITLRELGRRTGRDHGTLSRYLSYRAPRKVIADTHRKYQEGYRKSAYGRIYYMTKNAQNSARRKGIEFSLTAPFLQRMYEAQNGKCALTGIEFRTDHIEGMKVNPYTASLDRIDSSRGYTEDNVRLILYAMNAALGQWGERVFYNIAMAFVNGERSEQSSMVRAG